MTALPLLAMLKLVEVKAVEQLGVFKDAPANIVAAIRTLALAAL
jgi:hypothetical protein